MLLRHPGLLALALWLALALSPATTFAAEASAFGRVAVPQPVKPAKAESCVEPTDVMRREHMKFLDHQRDATVIAGERGGKYSLTGCIDCHNPARADGKIVRYPDPQHFCAACHNYASVRIDCFECHADRGLEEVIQGRLGTKLDAATLQHRIEAGDGD